MLSWFKISVNGEPDGSGRLQTEATTDDGDAGKESTLQTAGSKTAMMGRWGSTFWKDCEQMAPQNGSESGPESKSGSDYRNADGSEDISLDGRAGRLDSDDDDGQKEAGNWLNFSLVLVLKLICLVDVSEYQMV